MPYDNREYWTKVHANLKGQLKAVGHPYLSESYNQLKYSSEASSLDKALQDVIIAFRQNKDQKISFLDIGAGSGYWTGSISDRLSSQGYQIDVSALDMSNDALDVIKERFPFVLTIQDDLRTVSPDKFSESYDIVSACYCLHHLARVGEFINALRFAGSSVKKGGFLLIMDPVLTKPYSKLDTMDFYSFRSKGYPRHLYFVDDILSDQGLVRSAMYPAISFFLNGQIEAPGFLSYLVIRQIWIRMQGIYRSDRLTGMMSGALMSLDQMLKRNNLSFSSSVCVYHKQ